MDNQNNETLKDSSQISFELVQEGNSTGESGLGWEYHHINFKNKTTGEVHFTIDESFIDVDQVIWSDDGCRCAFSACYDTDEMMCKFDDGDHVPVAVVVDVLNCKLLKVYSFGNNLKLLWADNQQELIGLGNGADSMDDFWDVCSEAKEQEAIKRYLNYCEPHGFKFVEGPKQVSMSDSGKGFLNVDIKGQVLVSFSDGTLMEVDPNCRMYDAPHLVCWLPDESEVAFFARYKDCDCMCIVSREFGNADMWYLHSVPSAVVVEPSSNGSLRITPIVKGVHAFKAPFYFDDSEIVPNTVIKPEEKSTIVEEKPALTSHKSQRKQITRDSSSKNNLLVIIAISALIITWIAVSVLLLKNGYTKVGLPFLGIGSLGVFYAIISRLAINYKPRTSLKSLRWRLLVFFVAGFSTLTYQIARGINALVIAVIGSQPNLSLVFTFEGIITLASFVVFAILCRYTESDKKAISFAWLRMVSLALFIGFFIFWSRGQKTDYETQSYQDEQIELIEQEEDIYSNVDFRSMISDSTFNELFE